MFTMHGFIRAWKAQQNKKEIKNIGYTTITCRYITYIYKTKLTFNSLTNKLSKANTNLYGIQT